MKAKRLRIVLLFLLALAVLIGLPVWSVGLQVQQERRNRDLITAIKQNDTATAIALLNSGADANAEDRGDTPLPARHVLLDWWDRLRGRKPAASACHPSALIVASKIYDWQGIDCVAPPENVALFQALLAHGADVSARDKEGDTALILAAKFDHTATARLLLEKGADVNARDQGGETALMFAYSTHPTGMMELLLERGAHVNVKDKEGQTVLMDACMSRCYRRGLERLLAAGANVNAVDREGWTALIYAAKYGNMEAVKLLLSHGADSRIKNRDGYTALSFAKVYGDKECVRLLQQHGTKESTIGTP